MKMTTLQKATSFNFFSLIFLTLAFLFFDSYDVGILSFLIQSHFLTKTSRRRPGQI